MGRPVVLLVLVLFGCSHPGSVRPNSAATEGHFAGADSTRLFYRAVGTGPDTVVVVHGFQGNNQDYLAPDLLPLARGRTLLFYDQRGGGRSSPVLDPAQPDLEAHVRDLEALRQHFGFERLALLGHSGGAAIAVRYAVEHPERIERLALVTPPAPVRDPFSEQTMRAFLARVDSATWARLNALQASLPTAPNPVEVCREIAQTVLPRAYFADPAKAERMRGDFCTSSPAMLRTQTQRTIAFQQSLPAD